MQQEEEGLRPWWKKVVSVFAVQKENPRPAEVSQENAVSSQEESQKFAEPSVIPLEVKKQIDVPSLSDKTLQRVITPLSKPKKGGKTHFQQHQERMKESDAEVKHRRREKAKKKRELTNKKRVADAKRLQMVRQYADALRIKKMQCRNSWGRLQSDQWKLTVDEFIRSVIRAPSADTERWRKQINAIVGPADIKKIATVSTVLGATFEFEIAARLKKLGWDIQMLGKTGDQGGDILGQKNGRSVIIQCKNFSAKAGNGAVQEVVSGAQFYHASAAAVVARNGFTRQARALADKTSVLLLLPDQLHLLDNFIRKI